MHGFKKATDGAKRPQDGSELAQDERGGPQDSSKIALRGAQDGLNSPQSLKTKPKLASRLRRDAANSGMAQCSHKITHGESQKSPR